MEYATYLRVSTRKQGASGLGLEAQRKMCATYIENNQGTFLKEFVDVESGTHRDRKGLQAALAFCKENGCGLVIAKLDRLARDVEFCFKVINTKVDVHFTDMPVMNTLLLGVFASVAQYERELTSDRTKKALAVKKEQGAKLGASNESYKASVAAKSKGEIKEWNEKKNIARHERFLDSRDVKVFRAILQKTFPDLTKNKDSKKWKWGEITTRKKWGRIMVGYVKEYHGIDNSLFGSWPFDDDKKLLQRVRNMIQNYKNSINL